MVKNTHVFLAVLPYGIIRPLALRLRGVGAYLLRFFPYVAQELPKTTIDLEAEEYVSVALISYTFLSIVFGFFIWFLASQREFDVVQQIVLGSAVGLGLLIMLFIIGMRMPGIQAQTRAEGCNKFLIYGLKDIVVQINSGTTIYDAIKSVSKAGYPEVSEVFKRIVDLVEVGVSFQDALQQIGTQHGSEYLQKTIWQIKSSLRTGSDLSANLQNIIQDLDNTQKASIMNFARELNLWSLLYMLFAVAIPTIGSTMMVILSTFAGFGLSENFFIMYLVICFIIQFLLISFVKVRRPVVQF
ncbi:MAG: type II secretion system F family protein [Candidatus Woesearchaeota archaeon]